jgi:hypothetical protein
VRTSKAELLVNALRMHGPPLLAEMFAVDPKRPVTDSLLLFTGRLLRRRDTHDDLIIGALVAARRDEDIALSMREYVGERADCLAELMRVAQSRGELDPALSPDTLAHLCLVLAIGSSLMAPSFHTVDDPEWAALLTRIVTALGPVGSAAQSGADR